MKKAILLLSTMSLSDAFAGQGSGGGLLRSKESFEELKMNPSESIKMPADRRRMSEAALSGKMHKKSL